MPLIWATLGLAVGAGVDLLVRAIAMAREDTRDARCPVCESAVIDRRLLPLFGPLQVRRCAKCGGQPGRLPFAMQVAMAAAFGLLAFRWPLGLSLGAYSLYAAILAVFFVFDLRHRLIPDVVSYPAMLLAIVISGLVLQGFPGGLGSSLLGGLFGGGLFFALFLLAAVLYRKDDALGMGDVKLAFLIGLMAAWPRAGAAILLGTMLGAIIGLGIMMRAKSGRATMPYGTALALGTLASFVWPWPS